MNDNRIMAIGGPLDGQWVENRETLHGAEANVQTSYKYRSRNDLVPTTCTVIEYRRETVACDMPNSNPFANATQCVSFMVDKRLSIIEALALLTSRYARQ